MLYYVIPGQSIKVKIETMTQPIQTRKDNPKAKWEGENKEPKQQETFLSYSRKIENR